MSAPRSTFENGFGFLLADINRLARHEFDRRVRDVKLTRAQWLVLLHLARRPGCTQSELADAMQLQKITVSRHADRLVRAGWIERRDHAADGRAYRLFVSRQAVPLIKKLNAVAETLRSEYLTGLSLRRRDALVADLRHIRSNLARIDAAARPNPHEAN